MPTLEENCACAEAGGDVHPRELQRDILANLCQLVSLTNGSITPVEDVHYQQTIAVTAASTTVMPAYADRQYATVKNISDVNITVFLGTPAVLGAPTVVVPGDTFVVPPLYKGVVTAIRAAGAGTKNVESIDL